MGDWHFLMGFAGFGSAKGEEREDAHSRQTEPRGRRFLLEGTLRGWRELGEVSRGYPGAGGWNFHGLQITGHLVLRLRWMILVKSILVWIRTAVWKEQRATAGSRHTAR